MLSKGESQLLVSKARSDPFYHINKIQGVPYLSEPQLEVCRLLAKYDRVAVRACHGVGKTFIAAKIVLWFGSTFPNSRIITTAPTGRLVKELLWAEIAAGHKDSRFPLGGDMLTTQWKLGPKWDAIGFSPQKSSGDNTGSTFQGFHAPYILVIFDEATGIPPEVWEQVEGMLTGGFVRFLAIGNPTDPNTEFAKCFKSPLWKGVKIDCFSSPNLIANNITNVDLLTEYCDKLLNMDENRRLLELSSLHHPNPHLVGAKWVVQRALAWGVDSPIFMARALGEFPTFDAHALLSMADVEKAISRDPEDVKGETFIGVDPARMGADKTCIVAFRGNRMVHFEYMSKARNTEVAGRLLELASDLKFRVKIGVDPIGVGGGVFDILLESRPLRDRVFEVNAGDRRCAWPGESDRDIEKAKKRYANMRARMFHQLAIDVQNELHLMDRSEWLDQLPAIRYKFTGTGQRIIEPKEDFRARSGGLSPDASDAAAIANMVRKMENRQAREIRIHW